MRASPRHRRAAVAVPAAVLLPALLLAGCTGATAARSGSASVVTAGPTGAGPSGPSGPSGPPGAGSAAEGWATESTAVAPCPTPLTATAAVTCLADEAVSAVVARLAVMPDVARTKLAQHIPVEDPAAERAVADAFVAAATARGVPPDVAAGVIGDQIVAATGVQRNLLDSWTSGGRTADPSAGAPVADLTHELRPRIDAATERIAAALALLLPAGVPDGWQGALEQAQANLLPTLPDGVTVLDLAVALRTLRNPTGDGSVLQD